MNKLKEFFYNTQYELYIFLEETKEKISPILTKRLIILVGFFLGYTIGGLIVDILLSAIWIATFRSDYLEIEKIKEKKANFIQITTSMIIIITGNGHSLKAAMITATGMVMLIVFTGKR